MATEIYSVHNSLIQYIENDQIDGSGTMYDTENALYAPKTSKLFS